MHRARSVSRPKPFLRAIGASQRFVGEVDENATGSVNFFCPDAPAYPVDSSVRRRPREGQLNVPQQRLDEAKVETLRSWGEGLQTDTREEVRAAGRAITMLVEEIERLNIDLWHARTDLREPAGEATPTGNATIARSLPPPLPAY